MLRTTPPSHCLRSGQWSPCGQWWPVGASVPGIISIHIVIVPLPILGHLSTPDTRYTATAASGRAFQICGIKSVYLSNNTGWKVWLVHIALRARDFDEQDYFLSISANLFWFENDSQIFHKLSCAGLKQKQENHKRLCLHRVLPVLWKNPLAPRHGPSAHRRRCCCCTILSVIMDLNTTQSGECFVQNCTAIIHGKFGNYWIRSRHGGNGEPKKCWE